MNKAKLFLATLASIVFSGHAMAQNENDPHLHKSLKPHKGSSLSLLDVSTLPGRAEAPDRASATYRNPDGTIITATLSDINDDHIFGKDEITTLSIHDPKTGECKDYTPEGAERAGELTTAYHTASGDMLGEVKTNLNDGVVAKIYKDFYRLLKK